MSLIKAIFSGSLESAERGWSGGLSLGRNTLSGERVTPQKAAAIACYFACMRNIAQDTAKLPLRLYRHLPRGSALEWNHPVARLLRQPNSECVSMTARGTLMAWAVGWGNGYAEIIFDQRPDPVRLNLIHPARVTVKRKTKTDAIYYEVHNQAGQTSEIPAERMFHLVGESFNGVTGVSIAECGAESLGIALASQNFAAAFFGNGTMISGVLSTPKALDAEAAKRMGKSWEEAYGGGSKNAHKVAVLEQDLKFSPISMPMRDAEFLDSRRFQNEEIARWFRMPLSKLQDSVRAQGWSTLDAQNTDYVTDTLMPWLERMEQEAERKLLKPEEREALFIKHEVKGILRGDAKTRTDIIDKRIKNGTMTPNEGRDLEDENPSPDPAADKLYMQGAMMPLDKLGTQPGAKAAPADPEPQDPNARVEALRPFFADAAGRVMRKHGKAVESHMGRKDYQDWYAEFAKEQIAYSLEAFAPCFEKLDLQPMEAHAMARGFFLHANMLSAETLCNTMMAAALAALVAKGNEDA